MFRLADLDKDLHEGAPDWLGRLLENTLEGKRTLCKAATILAEQGELCRRYLQYDPQRIPTEEDLQLLLTPMDILALRTTVMAAINDGYSGKTQEQGDVDLGLLELEKKKKPIAALTI